MLLKAGRISQGRHIGNQVPQMAKALMGIGTVAYSARQEFAIAHFMATSRYKVIVSGECKALIFIGLHPEQEDQRVAVIIPQTRTGSWAREEVVDVSLGLPISDQFAADVSDEEIQTTLATMAGLPLEGTTFKSYPGLEPMGV